MGWGCRRWAFPVSKAPGQSQPQILRFAQDDTCFLEDDGCLLEDDGCFLENYSFFFLKDNSYFLKC